MTPKAKSKAEKEITLTVVGLQHRLTKTKLVKFQENLPLQAELRREPGNEYDENAIAVWSVERPFREVKIGYIKREVAADLASAMDIGKFDPTEAWLVETEISKSGIGGEGHIARLLVKL